MKFVPLLVIVAVALPASATHVQCMSVDPASILVLNDQGTGLIGRTFYVEERGNPLGVPVPGGAILLGPDSDGDGVPEPFEGQGTYIWEETNGQPGLQMGDQGGIGLLGDWFPPGCDQNPDWEPTDGTVPCLIIDEDPINDEGCFGDTLHLGIKWEWSN